MPEPGFAVTDFERTGFEAEGNDRSFDATSAHADPLAVGITVSAGVR